MRSLQTQVRIRRLLRVYSEYAERLSESPADRALAEVAQTKLFELARSVHEAWSLDSATVAVPAIRRHVTRTLGAVDASIAGLGRTGADPRRLEAELQDAALPLLLTLRGMEDVAERQVLDWLGAGALAKSA